MGMKYYYVVEKKTFKTMDRLVVRKKAEAVKKFKKSFGGKKYFLTATVTC